MNSQGNIAKKKSQTLDQTVYKASAFCTHDTMPVDQGLTSQTHTRGLNIDFPHARGPENIPARLNRSRLVPQHDGEGDRGGGSDDDCRPEGDFMPGDLDDPE